MNRIELCHTLIAALKVTTQEIRLITEEDYDQMPIVKAILFKALLKSYQESDFSLPMMIFHKIFGQAEWGTEYLAALKISSQVSTQEQLNNLKNFVSTLEAKEKELANET